MIADIKKNVEQKMNKSLEALKADLGKMRTGRAHTGILDHVMVDYYGSPTAVNQVANITLIDARTIGVSAVGKEHDRPDRKGDSRFRSGFESGDQRRSDPRADADADRRTPPRPDQGGQERRRKCQGRRAQHPPRCQRATEEAAQGQRGRAKTTNAARRTKCRNSPTASSPKSTSRCRQKKPT